MKKAFILTIILFTSFCANAQEVPDSLKIEKYGWSYYQFDYRLRLSDMMQITSHNDEAWSELHSARSNYWIATVFSSAGGACIGYALGRSLYGNELNMMQIYVGCGLVAFSIPFTVGYYVHLNKGVKIYNQGLQPPAVNKLRFKAGLTSNGIGLSMRF
jgi:hypothetical protein